MNLFPQDLDIALYQTTFEGDFLDRTKISKQLSELVEKIDDPIVVALDDKWGSGKTYFLKRWVAAHKTQNDGTATTVYFDAFESDYLSDPLVSLISAVSQRIPKGQESTLKKWKAAAAKLAKPAFGIALSVAAFGAKQHLEELGDAIADAVSAETKDATLDLWKREQERLDSMAAFKGYLAQLANEEHSRIVIVVDELDRCRPDYALSVLETIKHFFTVPKVHFVLGVNREALENSVKARYGSDIDAERYLRKFINLSFSLPRRIGENGGIATVSQYAQKMTAQMGLPTEVTNRTIALLTLVAQNKEVSLRDVGKVLSKIALIPEAYYRVKFLSGWTDMLCVLVVSSVIEPRFHKVLLSSEASFDEVVSFLGVTKEQVTEHIDGAYNRAYNHDAAIWLLIILYCCSHENLNDLQFLPEWKSKVGSIFDQFGTPRDPRAIPSRIQADWIDLFRL